jgi:hypothetical protein
MSEMKKRNVLTAEFKAKVGLEAVRGVNTPPLSLTSLFHQAKVLSEVCGSLVR